MDAADFLFPQDLKISDLHFKRVIFIGSCVSESLVRALRLLLTEIKFEYILFNNASQLPFKSKEELKTYDLQYIQLPIRHILTDGIFKKDLWNSFDWYEIGVANIDAMLDPALSYYNSTGLLTVVSGFIVPISSYSPSLSDQLSKQDIRSIIIKLNIYLADKIKNINGVYFADIDLIASAIGKRHVSDDFIAFGSHGGLIYDDWKEVGRIETVPDFNKIYEAKTSEFFAAVWRQAVTIARTARQQDSIKIVFFDLDNTMYRGQIVDDYGGDRDRPHDHGWPRGMWDAAQNLRRRGILVCICSKNDYEIVKNRWIDVIDESFLQLDDFILCQINWNSKAENIANMLSSVSLTAKSALFVDDNPVERAAVKAALPDIRVTGSNPYETRRILLWSSETQLPVVTPEAIDREQMVGAQIIRESARNNIDHSQFIASLQVNVKLWELLDIHHHSFARVMDLVNKTNQFNTTTRRWKLADFNTFFEGGGKLFAFSADDRFTKYGTIGTVFVSRSLKIEQFVMSCRALGLEIENSVLATLSRHIRETRQGSIVGEIIPTEVNGPCRNLFLNAGFDPNPDDANSFFLAINKTVQANEHVNIVFKAAHIDVWKEVSKL